MSEDITKKIVELIERYKLDMVVLAEEAEYSESSMTLSNVIEDLESLISEGKRDE